MGVVNSKRIPLWFGVLGRLILIVLCISLTYYFSKALVANLSLLGYFIISVALLVKYRNLDDFSLQVSGNRVILVLLVEIGTAVFFGAAYTFLHPGFLVGTLLAVVLNFTVLLLALFIIGKGASTFSLVGLVFDTQFKYYVFVITVPLSLVFSPASLHNLNQITTAVKLLSTINTSIFAPDLVRI